MSKISEQKIKELGYFKDPLNRAEYTANNLFNACVECYDQAMQDFMEKACEWLSEHLFTKVVEDSPSQHYTRSVESMGNFITQTKFIEQFKNYMQDEM